MENIKHMENSLIGLAVGDAFGERFFVHPHTVEFVIENRAVPSQTVWKFTDDTHMALSIYDVLREHQTVDQDVLAQKFARRYADDRMRGYGGGAHRLLQEIGEGVPWEVAASNLFDGSGSFGNGGAMRVAPLGAYFFDDYERVAEEARKSAEITHANVNGKAGAISEENPALLKRCCRFWSRVKRGTTQISMTMKSTVERKSSNYNEG